MISEQTSVGAAGGSEKLGALQWLCTRFILLGCEAVCLLLSLRRGLLGVVRPFPTLGARVLHEGLRRRDQPHQTRQPAGGRMGWAVGAQAKSPPSGGG